MKTFALLFLLLIQFQENAFSQDGLFFSHKYRPGKKYRIKMENATDISVVYSGPEEYMEALKEKGVSNPTKQKTETSVDFYVETGKPASGEKFPIQIKYDKFESSDGRKVIPEGTIIYAHSDKKMPVLDSISSDEMSAEMKAGLLPMMQSLFTQIQVQEKHLKVGERLIQKNPISVPVANQNLQMDVTTEYHLLKIENGKGLFEITMYYTMKTEISGKDVTGKGKGSGTAVFDIANSFFTHYELLSELSMNFKIEELLMEMSTKQSILQEVAISEKN